MRGLRGGKEEGSAQGATVVPFPEYSPHETDHLLLDSVATRGRRSTLTALKTQEQLEGGAKKTIQWKSGGSTSAAGHLPAQINAKLFSKGQERRGLGPNGAASQQLRGTCYWTCDSKHSVINKLDGSLLVAVWWLASGQSAYGPVSMWT
ncbi:uncharacterized protein ACBT44_001263 isoform 2-T4 [Syngnathus typhle]